MMSSAAKSVNPLDATMTKTQVVRRRFKSGVPRKIENRVLSRMAALGRTFELFDRLRDEMIAARLNPDHAQAGLIYCQPETKGEEQVLARTIVLPKPGTGEVEEFCKKVMQLDKPLFLGVIFLQHDPDAIKAEQRNAVFVWQFMAGPEAEGRLLMARNQQLKGGFNAITN